MTLSGAGKRRIILVHDSGKLYFEALSAMESAGEILIESYYMHFMKFLMKGILRRDAVMAVKALRSMWFFVKSFFMQGCLVIIGMAPYDPAVMVWRRMAEKNILIYHTSWPYWDKAEYPESPGVFKGTVCREWKKFILHPNTFIACVIKKTKDEIIKKYGKEPSSIFVIPHAVNPDFFYPSRVPVSGLKAFFIGRLVREKGLRELKTVILSLKKENIHFGIAGSGKDGAMLDELKNMPKVSFYGHIKGREKTGEIMRGYNVLLLPSYKTKTWEELFGIVILEAMASGLAVISTDCIGPSHIIKNMKNGILVGQKDPDVMGEKLILLGKERGLMQKIVKNGFKTADKYSIARITILWKKIIGKVIEKNDRAGKRGA